MTNTWMPPRIGSDGRGNVKLTAYDGTEMIIQRKDISDLIDALAAERDRFKSIDPSNGQKPISLDDSDDDPDDTKPE